MSKDEASWPDADQAFARLVSPVVSDSAVFTFDPVPFDSSYAIQVFHDRNQDGKIDFRKLPFPKPKEGVGISHNTCRMGPPDYRKARVTVTGKTMTLRIELRY
ncbi:MAG: DUF2141 domain-containing protein [Candidatus Eisenbacteria bacterium]|nr:DUF2141 domain-containing protein [Candidatus Eisenbacteria bacterium]